MDDQGQWLRDYFEAESAKIEPYTLRWRAVLNATRDQILHLNNPDLTEAIAAGANAALLSDLYPYDGEAYVQRLQTKIDSHLARARDERHAYLMKLDEFADVSANTLGILNHDDLWLNSMWRITKQQHQAPAQITLPWKRLLATQRQMEQHINRYLELVSRYLVLAPDLAASVGGLYSNVATIDYYEARFPRWLAAYAAVLAD